MVTNEERNRRFQEIGEYYENRAVKCWEITSKGHLHGGYWDESNQDDEPWKGPLRLTELMIDWTEIGPDERFIDFGSGLGLPAILLAKTKGCLVEGVTASNHQCDMARQNTLAEGLEERVRFQVRDAACLPFGDAMFDGGWFLESIFHMGHAEALGEAHRVLKPGALLLITDFINLEHTTPEFIALQHDVLYAHHIRREEYPALLYAAGFELLEIVDMTNPVIVAADAKNRKAFELYRDEMLQVAEQDYIPFVEEVSSLFAANAGYVAVKARRR